MIRAAEFVETHPSRFVFLACGAPQSEQLAAFIQGRGRATGVGLCIGASLKFVTGQIQRAPRLIQRAGLESLYRLLQEPGRLWRRFITEQLPILALAVQVRLSPSLAADHTRRRLWR
jgi:exopolysaccharide biosynthesis WecB/TagA/CpsF family protein